MKLRINWKTGLQLAVVAVIIIIAFWLASFATEQEYILEFVGKYGYVGIVLISIVSGFNVLIPIPVIAFINLFTDAGLSFWLVITLISIGMTLGDSIGYIIGRTGKEVIIPEHDRYGIIAKLNELRDKHVGYPYAFMFLYASLAPLPNELVVIPLGFLGYRMWHIMTIVLIGNFIFNTIFAFGFLGIGQLL